MEFQRYNPIGDEERMAVKRVMESGVLSAYIGAWGQDFLGGPEVQAFEQELADHFQVKHAVTFNSLTSGLMAAVGAIGIEPGDEVIVSPWTMSATATAILIWGGIPVFADIEQDYYGLCPKQVSQKITPRTKAIMVTDIFGHGACLDELTALARQHNLKIIEDVAQAPGVRYQGRFCGTWGDIGGFSLNYHKHIHTGEGGFCITDDDDLALRMQLIRNHAESSVVGSPLKSPTNMVGFNFRMGELESAIGRCQLRKLNTLLARNQRKAEIFTDILAAVPEFKLATVAEGCEHAYYVFPIQLVHHADKRADFLQACAQAGVPGLFAGYVNAHRLPMYEKKQAFGKGYPWSMAAQDAANYHYGEGTCPLAERLKDQAFVGFIISMFELDEQQCQWLANKMVSVWRSLI